MGRPICIDAKTDGMSNVNVSQKYLRSEKMSMSMSQHENKDVDDIGFGFSFFPPQFQFQYVSGD